MAKRRVNTKFLIAVTVGVVGLGGGAVAYKTLSRENPAKYVALAEQMMGQGNYEKAAQNYGAAFGHGGQKDLDLLMKQAEAWRKLAETDEVYLSRALACWTKALEIDGKYVPALRKLVEFYDGFAKSRPTEYYPRVREYAERLAKADPSDKQAAAKVPMTVVQVWLHGAAADPKALDDAIAQLTALQPADPANAEIPTVLAQAYMKRAQEAARRSDMPGAERLLGQAAGVFEAALKGQDENVEMHARAASVYSVLGRGAQKPEVQKAYSDRAKAEIERVRAIAKPSDEKHTEELLAVATLLTQYGDAAGAEVVVKGLMDARPDDQMVRLAYAKSLAPLPGGRQRAIEVLSTPVTRKDLSPRTQRQYEALRLLDLTNLQLDQYPEHQELAEKEAAAKVIEENLSKLQPLAGDTAQYLRLRGQLMLLRGQETDAIQTLSKAQSVLRQQGGTDDRLTYSLATAYLATRQTGEAKTLLTDLLRRHADFVPARRMMAQMFLAENDPANADPHLQQLERLLPDDPDVKRMRMASLMLKKQPDEAKKLYDGLPEGDTRGRMSKAQIALGIGNNDDAVRLLDQVRRDNPKSVTVVRLLVAAHRARNDVPSALRVVDEAVAANPADLTLVGLRKALAGASGEEMVRFTREMVEKNPDVYARELQLATIATDENKGAEALAHLKEAEKLKPEDRQVLEALFQAYARDAKWELAGQYVDKLAKINADRANGSLYRFRLLMAQGKSAEALTAAQELSRKMPEFSQTWVTLAQAQQATGQVEAAVQSYQRALEKQSDNADAMRGLVDCCYLQNRPEDAQRYIALARRTFPTNVYFRELEMRHTLRHGDPDQAVAQAEEARKQAPDVRANWGNLAQAYWRAAVARRSKNDAAGVKDFGDRLHALTEEGIKKWPDERLFYAYQADLAASRGDMATGVDALKRLAAQPAWKGKPEVSLLLADYYANFRKFPEAEAAAREALAASAGGDDSAARQKLAAVQAAAGNVDEAIRTLDGRPDDRVMARQKLQLLVAARRLDSAEKLALSMLEKDPNAADVVNMLVGVYLEGGQFDQALARVNQVLAADPDNVPARFARGLVHLRSPKADVDAGIADMKAVRDKDARHVDARYWLAEALVAKGDHDGAIRELDAAVRIQPANKALRLRLAQVCSTATPPRWVDVERVLREGRAVQGMGDDPDLAMAEARMWIARRQADRAVDVARQAAGTSKGNPEVVRVYLDALLASGNYKRLIDETEKMFVPADATPWWAFQARAVAMRRLDKKDDALAEFERALNSKEAQEQEAVATTVMNKLAEEVGVDEALARIGPKAEGSHRWQLLQAILYQQKRDYANAIATVEKTLAGLDKMQPGERVNVLRFAGTLYLSAQPNPMPEKALEAFKRSLKEYPDDTAVLNNVASLLADYVEPARPQEALQYSQRAFDIMTKAGRVDPLVWDTHGRVLTMVNRVPEGIVLLQGAADRTSIPDVHYHLAEAYMLQKAPEEAQKHLVKAAAAIEVAKKAQQSVDPKMVKRVEELTAQAKQQIGAKAQAGAN
jgi:tetratricopeptide (TPR) repeat protein